MPNAPGGWKIEGQLQTVAAGPDGKAVEGVRVSFSTSLGHHGAVFVPSARYTKENVKAAVADAARLMDEVGQLTG